MDAINNMTGLTIALGVITLTLEKVVKHADSTGLEMDVTVNLRDLIAMTGTISSAVKYLELPDTKNEKDYKQAFEMATSVTMLVGGVLTTLFKKDVMDTVDELNAN